MSAMEMFASFDVRFWASDGIVSKSQSAAKASRADRRAPLTVARERSARERVLVSVASLAAAAAMSFQLSNPGAAVQTSFVLATPTPSEPGLFDESAQIPNGNDALAAFEERTKQLMSGLGSGRLPAFSPDTLSAARAAMQRRVSVVVGQNDWMAELAAKVTYSKD